MGSLAVARNKSSSWGISQGGGHSVRRENAWFQGSRLYRQAEEGSRELLLEFTNPDYPVLQHIREAAGRDTLTIRGPDECRDWVKKVNDKLVELCTQMSPQIAVPILLQAGADLRYAFYEKKQSWLQQPIGKVLAYVAGNIYAKRLVQSNSLARLRKALSCAALVDQLEAVHSAMQAFGDPDEQAIVRPTGIQCEGATAHALAQIQLAQDGDIHSRTGADTKKVFLHNTEGALQAVEAVLQGETPKNLTAFADTLFAELPGQPYQGFWAGLWIRLKLALFVAHLRSLVTRQPTGIAVFEFFFTPESKQLPREVIWPEAMRLYWDQQWYHRRIKSTPALMIDERPILKIQSSPDLYVTSFADTLDALSWFVEASLMEYADAGGAKLPDGVFKRLISGPFEHTVAEMFRSHGFMAGQVSEKGVWRVAERDVILEHPAKEVIPGEIDVLACHPTKMAVFIAECKVLSSPLRPESLRNLAGKLSTSDAEGFFVKLQDKVTWLRATDTFRRLPESCFVRSIILDRKTPGMRATPRQSVVDVDTLKQWLDRDFAPAEPST